LAVAIGATAAARVQLALLCHTLAVARSWQLETEKGDWRMALGEKQGFGGLGLRMQRLIGSCFRQGHERVVVIGSDLPGLEPRDLRLAFAALAQQPLVFGPASDGGYWLVGLSAAGFQRQRGLLFSGVPWGSDAVLAESLRQASSIGLSPWLLRQQADVDRIADLDPWLGEI
jgi:rSAM/selenodomain-associated transferase 1